jgi:uncharacterized coiled-coil protein SlyX
MNPRPESRIKVLEGRTSALEAAVEELAGDVAEELRAIRQELNKSYNEIGTLFDQNFEKLSVLETRLDRIEVAMATKEDVRRLDGRLDEQGKKLDQIFHVLQELQKKLGE